MPLSNIHEVEKLLRLLVERVEKLDEIENDPNFNHYTDYLLGYRRSAVKHVVLCIQVFYPNITEKQLVEGARKGKILI